MVSSQVRQERSQTARLREAVDSKLAALGKDITLLALRLWYLLLRDLAPELPLEVLRGRYIALGAVPFRGLLEALDSLCDAHIAVVSHRRPPSFIRDVVRSVPFQLRGLIRVLEGEIGDLSSMEVSSVRSWRTILSFLLRPDYPGVVEKEDTIQGWVDRVTQTKYDKSLSYEVWGAFALYTGSCLSDRVKELYAPTHGPGAVLLDPANGKTRKVSQYGKDFLLTNCPLMRMLGEERFFVELPASADPTPVVSVIDVPKNWKKRRTIAVETATRMYCQKGIQRALYQAISEDPFWCQHVDFAHPEKGYGLVRTGSKAGTYATVDLSAASDSVSLAIVQDMLCGSKTDQLLSWLMRARSSRARLPDGTVVRLKAFATMGNAFCFPIETLVFGTLCIVSILRCGGDPTRSRFRVYGDDIIIESEYFNVLTEVLCEAGFSVNAEKSFGGDSPFKESCGLECYSGHEVTPLRLPRTFALPEKGLQSRSAWVSLANAATQRGFYSLARDIRGLLIREWRLPIPFSPDGHIGLIGNDNSHLVHKWDEDHSAVGYAYTVDTVRTVPRAKQSLALSEWLAGAQGSASYDDSLAFWREELPVVKPDTSVSRSESGGVRHDLAVLYSCFV